MLSEYYPNSSNPDFYIEHSRSQIHKKVKYDHYHDFFELYYFLGDQMSYFIDNKNYRVKTHDMILINKFTYHRTSYENKDTKDNKDRILVAFDDNILDLINDETLKGKIIKLFMRKKVSYSDSFNKYLLNTFTNRILPAYYESSSPVRLLKSKLIFMELLLSVLEEVDETLLLEDIPFENPQGKRISEIINYINTNYHNDITLDLLCKTFYINKYYLCHIFKEITGISIIDFINKKRLVEAEKLLRYSKYNITEIAGIVGFNSVNYFISLYKKEYHDTPKVFRRQFILHNQIIN